MRLIENIKSIIENIKSIIRSIGRGIKAFTAVDYTDGEEVEIGKSEDPKMKELKDSLNRVDALERSFYVSSSNSSPKGGKGNSNIVDKVNVDNGKAIRQAEENGRTEGQEKSEQVER